MDKLDFLKFGLLDSTTVYALRLSFKSIYASPSSGEAYRDRRLTTNFEL